MLFRDGEHAATSRPMCRTVYALGNVPVQNRKHAVPKCRMCAFYIATSLFRPGEYAIPKWESVYFEIGRITLKAALLSSEERLRQNRKTSWIQEESLGVQDALLIYDRTERKTFFSQSAAWCSKTKDNNSLRELCQFRICPTPAASNLYAKRIPWSKATVVIKCGNDRLPVSCQDPFNFSHVSVALRLQSRRNQSCRHPDLRHCYVASE